jgi:3-hydroxybutyrate dehydrogenase
MSAKHKCVIVTGGANGIGKSISKRLAEEGHSIVIADVNEDDGLSVAKQVDGLFVHSDLTDRRACKKLIEVAYKEFGSVDILINNAGFQHISPVVEFDEDKWEQMISLMLTAPFLLTKYAWPFMKSNKWGRVINMASVHAQVASLNKVGYISAKHGLIGLTKTAALEGGELGITVNAICPSYVRTPLVDNQIAAQAKAHGIKEDKVIEKIMLKTIAIKHLIEPTEVAEMVRYLCSESAKSITGSSLNIDCGWTAQ